MNTKQTAHIGALICFDGLVLFWGNEEIALTYTLPTLHSAQGPSAAFLSPFSGNSSFQKTLSKNRSFASRQAINGSSCKKKIIKKLCP